MTKDRSKIGREIARVRGEISALNTYVDRLITLQGDSPLFSGPTQATTRKPRRTKAEMQAARVTQSTEEDK